MVATINIPSPLYLSLCSGKACLASPLGCLLLSSHPVPWVCGHMLRGVGDEGKGKWYFQQLLDPAPWLMEGVGSTYDLQSLKQILQHLW